MRAQFIRHSENPLDTLDIGRVEERKFRKLFSELKNNTLIPFCKKNRLNTQTIEEYYSKNEKTGREDICINIMGVKKNKECEYTMGLSKGKKEDDPSFFQVGYNLGGDENWIIGETAELKSGLEQIKKWIKGEV